jgi:hypothetical protein
MIFDVKMDFTRKARFVAGGHMPDPPSTITYSSAVSHDSARIAFLLAALNDVDILATDIGNAYLNASPREKVYNRWPRVWCRATREIRFNCKSPLWTKIKWGSLEISSSKYIVQSRFHVQPS